VGDGDHVDPLRLQLALGHFGLPRATGRRRPACRRACRSGTRHGPSHVSEASATGSPFALSGRERNAGRPTEQRNCTSMTRRALPPSLVVASGARRRQGEHRLRSTCLAAIPALAVATIHAFRDYVEGSSPIHGRSTALRWRSSSSGPLCERRCFLRAPCRPSPSRRSCWRSACSPCRDCSSSCGAARATRPRRVAGQVD